MKTLWPARLTFVAGCLLLLVAVILYQGGNAAHSGLRFQWRYNFLSDLGLASTSNSVRELFELGMTLLGTALIAYVLTAAKNAVTRISAVLGAVALVTMTLLPSDIFKWPHRLVLVAALVAIAICWTSLAPALSGQLEKIVTQITSAVLWSYLVFLIIYPLPDASLFASSVHAQVEKSVIVVFLFNFSLLLRSKYAP